MDSIKLESILSNILGNFTKSNNSEEYAFYCPFCRHYKRKLQINISSGKWHCWVCDNKGRNLFTLVKKLNINDKNIINNLKELQINNHTNYTINSKIYDKNVFLPAHYQPLYIKKNTPDYKNALYYVIKKRKLSIYDIMRYNIGYCEAGQYSGMIIIPSYDKNNNLNFFTARSYYDKTFKFKNPKASKDIIGFENLINWNYQITIVEGVFDAITSRINSIPLFGKTIQDKLKYTILINKPPKVYIALDPDALYNAIIIAEYFMKNDINTYIVDLSDKDPNELGFDEFDSIRNKSEKLNFNKLLKYKLNV